MSKVEQIRRRACVNESHLSKAALLGLLRDTSSFQFFSTLDSDSWAIYSFNPNTGEVCVQLTDASGERMVSVTVGQSFGLASN